MSKRFTDTDKWRNPWFRKLSPTYKSLWMYIVDACDNAGVWMVDIDLASFCIGEEIDVNSALEAFDGRVISIGDGKRWQVIDYVAFQFGQELNPKSKVHASVISLMKKHGIDPDSHRVSIPYPKGIHSPKDKDKNKNKNSCLITYPNTPLTPQGGEVRVSTEIPTPTTEEEKIEARLHVAKKYAPKVDDVVTYGLSRGIPQAEMIEFWDWHDQRGWTLSDGKPVVKWRVRFDSWMRKKGLMP